jgi:VWFA-related protein
VRLILLPAIACALTGSALSAQEPEFKISSDVELVLLDVSVRNARGAFVPDLTSGNFKIWENGSPQTIRWFAAVDHPLTAGLVLDHSGSMRPRSSQAAAAALRLARASHPEDEFFTVHFNDTVSFGLPAGAEFTSDAEQLRKSLDGGVPRGRTALYDGIRAGLEHLARGRHERKTLIVISDGADNVSRTTREEVLRLAAQSNAAIYVVGVYDPGSPDRDPAFLRRLAEATGGEAFFPASATELDRIAARIATDLRQRYSIGITPLDQRLDGSDRQLRVEATGPDGRGLRVRTRSHYVAASWEGRQ